MTRWGDGGPNREANQATQMAVTGLVVICCACASVLVVSWTLRLIIEWLG